MPQDLQCKRTHDLWGPEIRRTERESDPEPSELVLDLTRHRIITEGTALLIWLVFLALTRLCGGHRGALWHGWDLRLCPLLFGHRGGGKNLLFGLHNADMVRQGLLGPDLAAGIPGKHDLHLDSKHTYKNTQISQGYIIQFKIISKALFT